MANDLYRVSVTSPATLAEAVLISAAMRSVLPRVPDLMYVSFDGTTNKVVMASGISNNKGNSEIDKWQDDVRKAIRDAIGKFPGAWVTCNKGDYCITGKDRRGE